jgi:hypothetical protein
VSLKVTSFIFSSRKSQQKSGLLFSSNRPRSVLLLFFLVQISRLPVGFIQQATTSHSLFCG